MIAKAKTGNCAEVFGAVSYSFTENTKHSSIIMIGARRVRMRKYGGDEPLQILLAHGYIDNQSGTYNDLLIGEAYTNLRKLPLCQVEIKNPLSMVLLVGKDVLQGPRNGR